MHDLLITYELWIILLFTVPKHVLFVDIYYEGFYKKTEAKTIRH